MTAIHRKVCASALIILAGNFSPIHADVVPRDDFNADSETAAAVLQTWYNPRGLWTTTGWWNAANCVDALEGVIVANNGQNYLDVLDNTFELNSDSNFLNEFYDDEGWWALAWIHAYDLTGQERFLKMARLIFVDMTGGWNDHCGGGIWWKKNTRYVNAIANELFLSVAIRLHQRIPGDDGPGSCLDWALREWAWFKQTGMINGDNLINDGLDRRCENNGRTTWTYNQGVILGGLANLFKTTGDTNYLTQAAAIADAAIQHLSSKDGILMEPCEFGDCHGGDVPQFKGVFIRNLAELYDVTHNPKYLDFLTRNAHAVWFNDRDSANHLGLRWNGPFDGADAARQSSAMATLVAVAEPMTQNLPFAKGAGGAAFNHSVGAASGTLAWTCSPANSPHPGFALAGPFLASLPKGTHTVHFRMAVDRRGKSSDPLLRLDIKGANILAAQDVTWRSFAAKNKSQDFELAFDNPGGGEPLEFRLYWNAIPNAPALTISDVTVDGALNWTAANLAHEVGRHAGTSAWEADPLYDHASGFVSTGAEAFGLRSADYLAAFELAVDNFNWDKSVVATISVVDVGSKKTIVSRDLPRDEFPSILYRTFTLGFKAASGKRYEFQTFWHYAPHAPRLIERSVIVFPKKPDEKSA